MDIELFVLCDAATDYQGKMNILGTFDALWSRTSPVVHPYCAVALRLRFLKSEEGEHKININIIDGDGKSVVPPVDAAVNVRFSDRHPVSLSTNMILNLQGLKFHAFGEYAIDLSIDGKHKASLPLYINKMPDHGTA